MKTRTKNLDAYKGIRKVWTIRPSDRIVQSKKVYGKKDRRRNKKSWLDVKDSSVFD